MQGQRQARPNQMVTAAQAPGHEVKDGRSFGFDLQWMAQTIGTEDPNKINGVLADYISIKVANMYNYKDAGITDTQWADMFRAVYRPLAGKVHGW